jgi:signal transduction histidine kinase/ActR/RegA family two-component response regulator
MTRDRETNATTLLSRHSLALALACVLLGGGSAASYRLAMLAHLDRVAAERVAVSSQVDHVRGDLSRELFASLNLSDGLVTLVRLRGGIQQDEFDALAAAILRSSPVVRNVALAPGTVIRFIHPREGNETALGVDYAGVPNQRAAVQKAIRERRTVVAGPLALIQGGTGIIGRTPIFYRPAGPQASDEYWGITATVISFDRLVDVSGLERARGLLRLALRGLDGTGGTGPAFWGDVDIFQDDAVLMDVPLPSGSWVIAGAPKEGWPVFVAWRAPELVAGTVLSLALAVLVFQVLRVSRQRKAEVLARQRTEEDLRHVNRALAIKEFAIESVTSGIALVGLDGAVSYANQALAPMVGVAHVQPGTMLSELLGAAAAETVWRGLEGRGHWRGELMAPGGTAGAGGSRELDGALDTVRGPGGEALCHILIVQDVTDRKRMMAEVERSQRLSALSVFAGGVAHDFNNLLGGLFGNIELARAGLSHDHPASARLETASSAFERARDLTRRLLTFAIGSPPQRRRVAVVPFLRECCALSLSGSACPWDIDAPDGASLWDVFADANQLSQVVANILINARQAMPEGGRVRLRACNHHVSPAEMPDATAGGYVEITIEDDGPGIPPEVLPHIFEPFFTTKPAGSGLGLAMSYSIISAHDGRLTAAAAPGGGAAFTLLLPAITTESSSLPPSLPEAHADEYSCGRILLMDDEQLIRDMASRMLARGGYDVVAAHDGEEAVRLCREAIEAGAPFDAAILDVTVPGGMGGKEALRQLRDAQPGIAVVLSSGYGEVNAAVGECQPTAVLPKPYQMHELLACARAVVQRVPPPPA